MTTSAYRISGQEPGASRSSRRAARPVQTRERIRVNRARRVEPDHDPEPDHDHDPQPDPSPAAEPPRTGLWGALAGIESVTMFAAAVAAAAMLAGTWETSQADPRPIPGLTLGGVSIAGLDRPALELVADEVGQRTLDRELTLRAGAVETTITARALGATPEPGPVIEQALEFGRSGDLLSDLRARAEARTGNVDLRVGMRFDERMALAQLLELAPKVDTHVVAHAPRSRGSQGLAGRAGDRAVALRLAVERGPRARRRGRRDRARGRPQAAGRGPARDRWPIRSTSASCSARSRRPTQMDVDHGDRTSTSRSGPRPLDGHVLLPGEPFSFNEVVGDRGAENGYRWAPGISGGQIIDVLGGGICQVASTMFGASVLRRARGRPRPAAQPTQQLRRHGPRRDGRVGQRRPRAPQPLRISGRDPHDRQPGPGPRRDPRARSGPTRSRSSAA